MATTSNITGVFHYENETYIGQFVNNDKQRETIENQINDLIVEENAIESDNCIFINNPAKITFTLEKVTVSSTSSYEWRWTITPLLPKACVNSDSYKYNIFAFPKSKVAICGLEISDLDDSIKNAYNSLVE